MESRDDCFDNAAAERVFATLECELLARHRFPTRSATRLALFDAIEEVVRSTGRHLGTETWCCDGKEVGRVDVVYRRDEVDAMTPEYVACQTNGNCHVVRERVGLDRTRCTLGGARPWFVCSGCRMRRAVLFCVHGVFRCRVCHDLAYRSTREGRVLGRGSAVFRV